jgi:hypothetical protein
MCRHLDELIAGIDGRITGLEAEHAAVPMNAPGSSPWPG